MLILVAVGCDNRTPAPSPSKTTSSRTAPAPPKAREIDISHTDPGKSTRLTIAGRIVNLSVPAGEGASIGSFELSDSSTGFSMKGLERDGGMNRAWIGDVTADGIEDAVIVIQSAGSGSYVDVYLMETKTTNFLVSRLPELIAPGYMGHDEVRIQDGSIVRSFPTYIGEDKVRIDRQWEMKDAARGKLPIRKERDSNSNPSGTTKAFRFDRKAGWIPL